ncbi:MAG: hypothetical protein JXK95_04210 [Bacteroidales bacterium]|nr:hypothetical protein [Bacteroidales bacterium]
MKNILLTLAVIAFIILCPGCREDDFYTTSGDALTFSTDTVSFDTVFSSVGSATMGFKVYNPHNKPVKISAVYLGGGENSFYRMNFDGEPLRETTNVEIPAKDSLFVFIEVTIDPLGVNNPMIVKDSVIFITNGTYQDIKLIAYGQDIHLIRGEILRTTTWRADKPYLVYNSMAVDTGQTLTIDPGVKVFLHDQSSLIVWGKIIINGTKENPVIFQGDRLEEDYRIIAGQWGTIYIDPISTGNVIDYAIIKNAIAGIQIGYYASDLQPGLELKNTIIQNNSYVGIYAFGAHINCYNTVVANAGEYLVTLLRGGKYRFGHCTFVNYGVSPYGGQQAGSRSNPSLVMTNFYKYPEFDASTGKYVWVTRTRDLEEATFTNTIIYGTLENELLMGDNEENAFHYYFDHCLIKHHEDSLDFNDPLYFNAVKLNKNPEFINDTDRFELDFRLDTLSPAKDSGNIEIIVTNPYLEFDYDGTSRLNYDRKPDMGAFERKED